LQQTVKESSDDIKEVKSDVKEVQDEIKDLCNEFSSMVLKINAMNTTMEKLLDEQTKNTKNESDNINKFYQSKIDKIFKVHQLNLTDYEETDKEPRPRKEGRVTKWVSCRNKSAEFAFKNISEDKDSVKNQVTILKELFNNQNIIKFYGLTNEGNKWYLVTEWAEYGNLREFYTNPTHKSRFDLRLKLRMSLDIARGLNFLRTVEVIYIIYLIV
jgi:serine/threonine protein kinase